MNNTAVIYLGCNMSAKDKKKTIEICKEKDYKIIETIKSYESYDLISIWIFIGFIGLLV